MLSENAKSTLKNVINGVLISGENNHLTATRDFLCSGFSTSKKITKEFEEQSAIKKEQEKCLNKFIDKRQIWITDFDYKHSYLTEGGEAKIYFSKDRKHVVKLNDAIYYNNWLNFFNSVLIHNLIFADTAYTLLGFITNEQGLFAALQQPFIIADNYTNLSEVKTFLEHNGFINTKRNDYYNSELGLILEDIHDENVLLNKNKYFFIDTVFYINVC